VFSVRDERMGEEVGAAIHLKQGACLDASGLRETCGRYIAAFKVPRYLWFLDEPLPRNASGKFVKRALQESLPISDAQ
jgi:acyl-CoA synthetase (AMP-forming)/AMP-acid ligase II